MTVVRHHQPTQPCGLVDVVSPSGDGLEIHHQSAEALDALRGQYTTAQGPPCESSSIECLHSISGMQVSKWLSFADGSVV